MKLKMIFFLKSGLLVESDFVPEENLEENFIELVSSIFENNGVTVDQIKLGGTIVNAKELSAIKCIVKE